MSTTDDPVPQSFTHPLEIMGCNEVSIVAQHHFYIFFLMWFLIEKARIVVSILFLLYDGMCSQRWCCNDGGCFLLTSVDVLRDELRLLTKHPQKQREVS